MERWREHITVTFKAFCSIQKEFNNIISLIMFILIVIYLEKSIEYLISK